MCCRGRSLGGNHDHGAGRHHDHDDRAGRYYDDLGCGYHDDRRGDNHDGRRNHHHLAPPSVGQVSESHDPIWESYAGFDDCNGVPSQFNTSVISATITAPAGVQSVTMFWSVGDQNGSKPMTLNGGCTGPRSVHSKPRSQASFRRTSRSRSRSP